jgi:hypothetical protein
MGTVLSCSTCGKAFQPGTSGWMARFAAPTQEIRPDTRLTKILLCPEDYARLGAQQKAGWHEYIDPPHRGPTREKRPGHLKT